MNSSTLPELEAHNVLRYHAAPSVPSQTLGHHHARVATIILYLYPEASASLLREALMHDVGELLTGDIPFTTKRANPEFRAAAHELEERARLRFPVAGVCNNLSVKESALLKLADTLEGVAWCADNERLNGPVLPRWQVAYESWRTKNLELFEPAFASQVTSLYNSLLNPHRYHEF